MIKKARAFPCMIDLTNILITMTATIDYSTEYERRVVVGQAGIHYLILTV